MDAILARQLLGNGEGFVEIGVGDLIDTVVQIFGVLREELEFLGFLRSDLLEFGLSLADHLDERLGGFETTGDDFLVRLGLAFVVDEVPGVLACAGFDHGDGDVAVFDDTAGNHDSNTARSRSLQRGKATHWPSIRARRTPETGPSNGRPEIMVEAEAAFRAITS